MRFRSNRMKEGYIYLSSGSQPWRRLRFLMSSLRLRPSYQTWMTIEPHYLVMTGSKIVEPFRNVNVWNLDSNSFVSAIEKGFFHCLVRPIVNGCSEHP